MNTGCGSSALQKWIVAQWTRWHQYEVRFLAAYVLRLHVVLEKLFVLLLWYVLLPSVHLVDLENVNTIAGCAAIKIRCWLIRFQLWHLWSWIEAVWDLDGRIIHVPQGVAFLFVVSHHLVCKNFFANIWWLPVLSAGGLNYFIIQNLKRYSCFSQFLPRFRRINTVDFIYCFVLIWTLQT